MVKVLVLGGGGMIGQKYAADLAAAGFDGRPAEVILQDIAFPPDGAPASDRITGSLTDPETSKRLAGLRADVIINLAAVVSGEAEVDFDKGWQVNMFATWHLLEALRAEHVATGGDYVPRLVFSSSIAVFGAPFPEAIGDEFLSAPLTSYGAQKAACELMVGDFSRKGFVDGISIRLPTICVRPGKPNKAASGFFSGIIREPLNGLEAVLPVPDTVRHWHASPRSAVGFLNHAATLDSDLLGARRALNMPGVSCTVAEQIEALGQAAGPEAVGRIRREPDLTIMSIVDGWPRNFDASRALELGFSAEPDFRSIVDVYIADELS